MKIAEIIRREVLKEFRSFHQIGSVLVFLLGCSYLVYFFASHASLELWNLMFWMIHLFTGFYAGYRVFEDDLGRYRVLTNQLFDYGSLFVARTIFLFTFLSLVSLLQFVLFNILVPIPDIRIFDWVALVALVNFGLSLVFCFNSFLSSQGNQRTLLFAVLALPLSFPIFGSAYLSGIQVLQSQINFWDIAPIRIIFSINLFALALVYILMPLIWRN